MTDKKRPDFKSEEWKAFAKGMLDNFKRTIFESEVKRGIPAKEAWPELKVLPDLSANVKVLDVVPVFEMCHRDKKGGIPPYQFSNVGFGCGISGTECPTCESHHGGNNPWADIEWLDSKIHPEANWDWHRLALSSAAVKALRSAGVGFGVVEVKAHRGKRRVDPKVMRDESWFVVSADVRATLNVNSGRLMANVVLCRTCGFIKWRSNEPTIEVFLHPEYRMSLFRPIQQFFDRLYCTVECKDAIIKSGVGGISFEPFGFAKIIGDRED